MRIETINIYKYGELSDGSKAVARDWFRDEGVCDFIYKDWLHSKEAFKELFTLFDESEPLWDMSGNRLRTYLLNNWPEVFDSRPKEFKVGLYTRKSKVLFTELDPADYLTGDNLDRVHFEPIISFVKEPSDLTFFELIEECILAGRKVYKEEYEYRESDEAVEEDIIANEYEFTADGQIY